MGTAAMVSGCRSSNKGDKSKVERRKTSLDNKLFPSLNLAQIWDLKEEPFNLPRDYTSLKLELQRTQTVMTQSLGFSSPQKTMSQGQDGWLHDLNVTCSPSLLRKATVAGRKR